MSIPKKLIFPMYMAILVAFSVSVGFVSNLLGAYNPTAWGVFTLFGVLSLVIAYTWGRQIWWYISGTGDYHGRVGILKTLWLRIFKK